MEVSIEEINGRKCTVIRKPFDAEWVKEQLSMDNPVLVDCGRIITLVGYYICPDSEGEKVTIYDAYFEASNEYDWASSMKDYAGHGFKYTLTTLPPLPRHPKPEDARLLYRYASEGLRALGKIELSEYKCYDAFIASLIHLHINEIITLTHAIHNGERVEIAIEEGL